MTRAYLPLLLTLSALWGASYLFIKVAVDEIDPIPMIELRLLLAGAVLLAFLVARMGRRDDGKSSTRGRCSNGLHRLLQKLH